MKKLILTVFSFAVCALASAAVDVTATMLNEQIGDAGDYMGTLYSADGKYKFVFDIIEDMEPGVTFNLDKHMSEVYSYCEDYQDNKTVFYRSAEYTLTIVDGLKHVEARALLVDGREFTIHYQDREGIHPKDTVDFVATKLSIMDMTDYGDMATITAENADYTIDLWLQPISSLYNTPFTEANLNVNFSPLIFLKDGGKTRLAIQRAEFIVTKNGVDPVVSGWLYCSDDVLYMIDFHYELPTASSNLSLDISAGDLIDAATKLHYIEAYGYDDAAEYYLALVFVTNTFHQGQYKREDLYSNYSGLTRVEDDEQYLILSADVELSINKQGQAVLVGKVLAQSKQDKADVISLDLTMTCDIEHKGTGLDSDAMDEDFDKTFTANQFEANDMYWMENHSVYLEAMDESDNSLATIQLILPATTDIYREGIKDGVYPINDTEEDNTVLASRGTLGGSVYPSYAGYLNPSGTMHEPMWFLVSGEVIIETRNDVPYVTVNAKNSYGRTIHIVMDGTQTEGVENVQIDNLPYKVMHDGVVEIHRDGKVFNVLGTQM